VTAGPIGTGRTSPDPNSPGPSSSPGPTGTGAGATGTGPQAEPVPATLTWRRLHPVTPLLKGWAVVAVVLFVVARQSAEGENLRLLVDAGLWAVGGVVLVLAVIALAMWVSWRRAEYAYDDVSLYLRSGVVFRQHRSVRLDRVQAINVNKPLLARIFGLAQLTFEAAGGKSAHIALGYLRDGEAESLRAELLARAAGIHVPATTDASGVPAPAPVAPERQVLEVAPARVLGASLLSGLTLAAVVAVLVLVGFVVALRSFTPVFAFVFPVIGLVTAVFQRFSQQFGFTAAISPDGVRVRHGLLQSMTQTIPPGRVQAVQLSQPLLWRATGWWKVCINVAGYSDDDQSKDQTVLLPVGTLDEALLVLWLVEPEIVDGPEVELVRAGLLGRSTQAGDPFTAAPRRTRWLDPIAWRRHGYAVTRRALLVRGGGLVRRLSVVPHERTQSLGVTQGPWQRSLGVASFQLHSTPGRVRPAVDHLTTSDVARLEREQSARARAARATARPDRWMHPAAPTPPVPENHLP